MKESLRDLDTLNNCQLTKAILQRNNMLDPLFGLILQGLRTRPEFCSLISETNEIGEQATVQICNLIDHTNKNPKFEFMKEPPYLTELKLMNSKCNPRCMDQIITSIKQSQSLQKLSLQRMDLSERQITSLLQFIRDSTKIKELDISWNKLPMNKIGNLFQALETNTSIQNLNIAWI